MARLSVKVSLKSLGQPEERAGFPPHLWKAASYHKQFKLLQQILKIPRVSTKAADELLFPSLYCPVPANVSVSYFVCLPWKDTTQEISVVGPTWMYDFLLLFCTWGISNTALNIQMLGHWFLDMQRQWNTLKHTRSRSKIYVLAKDFSTWEKLGRTLT